MSWLFPGLFELPNLHPLFVHFPIAFWFGAFALSCLGAWRSATAFQLGIWMLHLGTLTGLVAVVSGFVAAAPLDHAAAGHDLVHVHRNLMLVASILSVIASATVFLLRRDHGRRSHLTQVALIAAVAGLAALGADRGAVLVYRHGVGVGTAPAGAAPEHGHDNTPHTHEHR